MLARCGTFHPSTWLRWTRDVILGSGRDTARKGAWCGNKPTYFSSNLLVPSFSKRFLNASCEPSLEAGPWEMQEEGKVPCLPSRCWHLFLQSPYMGWPWSPSLPSSLPSLHSLPCGPTAINSTDKYPHDSRIRTSGPDFQTHIQLPTQNLHFMSDRHLRLTCPNSFLVVCLNFYWSRVDLQCWVSFCCTAKWISYTYTHVHSFLDSFPI